MECSPPGYVTRGGQAPEEAAEFYPPASLKSATERDHVLNSQHSLLEWEVEVENKGIKGKFQGCEKEKPLGNNEVT